MMDRIHDYAPVAVAVVFVLAALWLAVRHGEARGYLKGRAQAHREIFGPKRRMRL